MDRTHKADRRGFVQPPSPPISDRHWTDDDLKFFTEFNQYEIDSQTGEVQIMLDLASMLMDARVEWLMKQARADQVNQSDGKHIGSYREPRHTQPRGCFRHGYDPAK